MKIIQKTKLLIEINIDKDVKLDSILKKYPTISNQEKELLSWNIFGDICISYGDIILTKSINSNSNYISEYIWQFITNIHMKLPKLLTGKTITQAFFDDPEILTFTKNNEDIKITFDCGCKNHKPHQEITVPITDFFSALLDATKQLTNQLLAINPKLNKSEEVIILLDAYNKTKKLIK